VMPLKEQLKSLFTDKYWVMIAVITALYAFAAQARTISLVYYCEWTLGTYESYRLSYALIQMVGGLPLWIGALVIHPILKKVSKQKAICIGLFIAAFGDALEFFFMKNIYVVVTGAVIRNIGLVPISYSFTALLADVMDHIAYVKGQRCDGAVISGDTIIKTIFYGLGTSVVNLAMWLNNYQAPDASLETQAAQSEAMQRGFGFVFSGIPAITALTGAVIFLFLDVEKKNEILKNARSAKGE
jgi:GPH family glycoside/pentoside/hexuronide:cation symporter